MRYKYFFVCHKCGNMFGAVTSADLCDCRVMNTPHPPDWARLQRGSQTVWECPDCNGVAMIEQLLTKAFGQYVRVIEIEIQNDDDTGGPEPTDHGDIWLRP